MRELSLFTGAGGGLLGTHLLGWTPIGYVEINEYCQNVIRARIDDGILPVAPIFTDVREFVQSGAARQYRGFADVVTAGFPCQPFSVAGKQTGANDERNMWPETIECIRQVRPRYTMLENVPGLLNSGYFQRILGDLAESGYDARWRVLSAAELGAPHKRDRLWIAALDNTVCQRWDTGRSYHKSHEWHITGTTDEHPKQMAYANGERQSQSKGIEQDKRGWASNGSAAIRNTPISGLENGQHEAMGASEEGYQESQPQRSTWWETEPDVGRLVDGFPTRVDQLKALGNGQVPAVAATAWRILSGEF